MTDYNRELKPGQQQIIRRPPKAGKWVNRSIIELAEGDTARITTGVVVEPPPPEPPPEGEWGPPLTNIRGVSTPQTAVPAFLSPVIDPNFGTKITRIGEAGQRHAYSRIQAWSPSEKYLFLHYGGQWLLDGRTYARIHQLATPYVASWVSDTTMVGTSGNRVIEYNVETRTSVTRRTFTDYSSLSMGEGEGAPSRDFRYLSLVGRRTNGSTGLITYDRIADSVVAEITLPAHPNNCTMSRLGNYVVVGWNTNGTGQTQGTHLYTRSLQHVRQLFTGTDHADVGVDAAGREVICHVASGAAACQVLNGGTDHNLLKMPNVWAWVGHVSCTGPDGWALWSPNSYHSESQYGLYRGNDQLASADMSKTDSDTVKVWGHQHDFRNEYDAEPMAIQSPSGTRVLFGSSWGTSTYYPFVAST